MRIRNRRIVVLGLGATGLSVARWAARRGGRVSGADTRSDPPRLAQLRAELPQLPVATGPITDATLADAELIVISPGLAKDQAPIRDAVARGVELVGDIEIFAQALPRGPKLLAITRSNGKTTVTALTAELLRAAGMTAAAIGNIGEPVLDALGAYERGTSWPDVFVLELSSFQLETTASLKPA